MSILQTMSKRIVSRHGESCYRSGTVATPFGATKVKACRPVPVFTVIF
jgi:hypothetical protein